MSAYCVSTTSWLLLIEERQDQPKQEKHGVDQCLYSQLQPQEGVYEAATGRDTGFNCFRPFVVIPGHVSCH